MSRYFIINFHAIRPERIRGINPCTTATFLSQLNRFASESKIVSLHELWDAVLQQREDVFCAFTFDDGFKEHYEIVLPALRSRGVLGTFFPMGLILAEQKIPLTHKLQFLLSVLSAREIADRLHNFFDKKYRVDDTIRLTQKWRFDDVLTANLKHILMHLSFDERSLFLDTLFNQRFGDERAMAEKYFLTTEEVKKIKDAGMEIGGHGYRHLGYDAMDTEGQRDDIFAGQKVLQDILGEPPAVFSYPHGRATPETIEIMHDAGIAFGLSIEPRDIITEDNPLFLPRYDTNDFSR